jgi:hypothetical protein
MALKDIVVQRETIRFNGGEFEVRAINFDVINRIMVEGQRGELDRAIQFLEESLHPETKTSSEADLIGSLSTLVMEMPHLVAKVVAYCADEPDQVATFAGLSLSVQLDAILAICKLTFTGDDSIKKFLASVIELMVMMRKSAKPAVEGATAALAGMKA